MSRNNEVTGALKQYFSVDSIEVLCVDTKKVRKNFAKAMKSRQEPGSIAHTFVSALCDLFVVLTTATDLHCIRRAAAVHELEPEWPIRKNY